MDFKNLLAPLEKIRKKDQEKQSTFGKAFSQTEKNNSSVEINVFKKLITTFFYFEQATCATIIGIPGNKFKHNVTEACSYLF